MKKSRARRFAWLAVVLLSMLALSGCGPAEGEKNGPETEKQTKAQEKKPPLPDKLKTGADGEPVLNVFETDEGETRQMGIESYVQGVLAGEMKNDWPMEALKAQAILARTFVLKFCTEKESKYQGADISTDIEEAQAYDATGVNERIEQAVKETKGMVLSCHGELPYAWFHAHSGGLTERAVEGLHYEGAEPGYTKVTQGRESGMAPEEAREWTAEFSEEAFLAAAKEAGWQGGDTLASVEIGKKGESGRAVTLRINGESVSAPELRLALDSTKMRSTLLTECALRDGKVYLAGKGYGHGVGMPQWGAYGMAEEGKTAEEIVRYYFHDVTVETLW